MGPSCATQQAQRPAKSVPVPCVTCDYYATTQIWIKKIDRNLSTFDLDVHLTKPALEDVNG